MKLLTSLVSIEKPTDVFSSFERVAHDLINHWEIIHEDRRYQILELEFFASSSKLEQLDPYVDEYPIRSTFGRWMLNLNGVELTLGNADIFLSARLRSVQCAETGKVFNGPNRVFREIFMDLGDALAPSDLPRLHRIEGGEDVGVIAVPRVGLNFTEFSGEMDVRADYLLRPYRLAAERFVDLADKYIALLYIEKISNVSIPVGAEHSIYKKYLQAYEKGFSGTSIEVVWEERSKSLRIARLLGYQAARKGLFLPEVSNQNLDESLIEDLTKN